MNFKRALALFSSAALAVSMLAACGGSAASKTESTLAGESTASTSTAAGGNASGGKVYFLNFKPEQDEAYQAIAKTYTAETGVAVKVETAASGTYEQTLRSEMGKKDAPTIFQVNGPVGFAAWKEYCQDLSTSDIYSHLADKSLAITEGEGVFAIPFAIEGYGIIVNNKIMAKYFEAEGAKAKSMDEINNFAKLKEVAEDMQAKKDTLGIDGVFASTSLAKGEDWRWQTHLMNVPMYYEWSKNNVDLSVSANTDTIKFEFNENFKNIFDLYLNNSTIAPALTSAKTVSDSMAEFALGKAAMVQNGNWAYSQISEVQGNTVMAEDVTFMPIYTGMEGEDKQGLCIGTENFFCINKNSSEADQQASLDFLTWLYTSDAGKAHVTNDLGFIAPFDTFTDADKPADPLGQQVMEWSAKSDISNVPWNFTVFPSQQFKDNFGSDLQMYAQGTTEWTMVVENVITNWAAEKAAAQ